MGIDPGLAGSAGGAQLPTKPDDPVRDLAAVRALRPAGRIVVVRLNRLFWADGEPAIRHFADEADRYGRAGFGVEIQVRYHPASGEAGDIAGWTRYVRHVVDVLGRRRGVVAMTITNEVNLNFSPNTSDGAYSGARDALIAGIEAARAQADRDGLRRLRFGFTYAYRMPQDTDFFSYLGSHGGTAFRRALSFIGLDFYPGSVYPPAMAPGETFRSDLAQAAGVLRGCFAPLAGIGRSVPIWITETGVPSGGSGGETGQAAGLRELITAASELSGTFGITDLRWFNLRDSVTGSPEDAVGPAFASDGLLRDDYSAKPSFAAFRSMIATLGAREPAGRSVPRRGRHRPVHHHRRRHRQRRHDLA
jgi:hypothetical protein